MPEIRAVFDIVNYRRATASLLCGMTNLKPFKARGFGGAEGFDTITRLKLLRKAERASDKPLAGLQTNICRTLDS